MAAVFPGRYDSAASVRLIGLALDQEDDPWWLSDALGWLAMYQAIMGAWGRTAAGLRAQMEVELERQGPGWLYGFYARWSDVMRREAAASWSQGS